jgi:intein/homing endonuclease
MNIVDFFLDIERNDLQYFLTNPRAKNTEKQQRMTSAYFQASKKMRKEQGRNLTEEEKHKAIRDAEKAYNREMLQRRKSMVFDKVASITL